jgi:hypothetical protein
MHSALHPVQVRYTLAPREARKYTVGGRQKAGRHSEKVGQSTPGGLMANRQALEEISQNPLASQAQRDAAFQALHRLDNPERVVRPEPTAQAALPAAESLGKYFHVTPDRVGLLFSGISLVDDPAGYKAADAKVLASGRCPQWDGPAYRIAQAEEWNAEWALKGFGPTFLVVDGDVRMIDKKTGRIMSYENFMFGVNKKPVKDEAQGYVRNSCL